MGNDPWLLGIATALLAAAVLVLPPRARVGWPSGRDGRSDGRSGAFPAFATHDRSVIGEFLQRIESRSQRRVSVIFAAAFGGLALLAGGLSAIAGIIAGACVGRAVHQAVRTRAAARREAADVETLQSLADELRAGQDVAAAMSMASEVADGALAPGLRAAASAVRFGADPGRVLTDESTSAHAPRLAALYGLTQTRGAPLADAVDDLASLGRARLTHDRRIRALLAGPGATAVLLCLLPVFGLVMGEAIGARPVAFLTGSVAGGLVLIAGVTLACTGALWTQAMVSRARGAA